MFDYTLAHWTSFFIAAILLNIAPGPDMAFILSHTVRGGKKTGVAAMLGIWTGAFGHVLLAAVGLSAIIMASATAFSIIKWVGVFYLVWLGIQAIRSDGGDDGNFSNMSNKNERSIKSVYYQGALIDLLNPKVATFFLAFLPQFVVAGAGPAWAQLLLHGTLIIIVAALVEPPLIYFGGHISESLRRNRKLRVWLDRAMGSVLIAIGAKLAMSER